MDFQVGLFVDASELRKLQTTYPKFKHLFRIEIDENFQPTKIFGILLEREK